MLKHHGIFRFLLGKPLQKKPLKKWFPKMHFTDINTLPVLYKYQWLFVNSSNDRDKYHHKQIHQHM